MWNSIVKDLAVADQNWRQVAYSTSDRRADAIAALERAWDVVAQDVHEVSGKSEGPRMEHTVRIEWSGPMFACGPDDSDYDWGSDEYESHDRAALVRYALCRLADMKEDGYQSVDVYFDGLPSSLTMDEFCSMSEILSA